jgi:hypothetical protein
LKLKYEERVTAFNLCFSFNMRPYTTAAACESALSAARGPGGCAAAEHADCLNPVAHNFQTLLAAHRSPVAE